MSTFRLINFLEDPAFNGLRYAMGAKLVPAFGGRRTVRFLDEDAIRRLGTEGIDVAFDEVKVEGDGTLSYKGKRVVVYIRDVPSYKGSFSLPRFHFSYCDTLESMRQHNRWGRYVVANREDGFFVVNFIGNEVRAESHRLNVCQNCLALVAWDGFTKSLPTAAKKGIVKGFALDAFFERYPKDLLSIIPTYSVDTAPINDYTEDWGLISEGLKEAKSYTCEGCRLKVHREDRMYLHVHHRNGEKNDNSKDNLQVLCLGCHSEEPQHGHLKALGAYKEFVKKYQYWGS